MPTRTRQKHGPRTGFRHISNACACDRSIFPTVGSVSTILTGLTLASRLADHLPF